MALVSESWITDGEFGLGFGGGIDNYGRRPFNRQPRGTRPIRTTARPIEPWLADQNNVATGGTGNPPPINKNNLRNTRNRNNASQATANNAWSQEPSTQPQPQGRNRNRGRNKNRNRDGQQAGGNEQNEGTSGPPNRGPRTNQNNRGGRRGNQSNIEAPNNSTTDPVTGEIISKRAAKRRRAKARKAAAAAKEAAEEQTNTQQQPRVQTRPQATQSSTSTSQTAATGNAQQSNPGTTSANPLPSLSVPPVSSTSRVPFRPNPQPERTDTSAIRPTVTTSTTASGQATQPTPRVSANHEASNRPSPENDTIQRWRRLLDPDSVQTVRPASSVISEPRSHAGLSCSHVRRPPVVPPVPLANRNLPNPVQPARAGVPSTARAGPSIINRPAPARTRFIWDSDDEDEFGEMPHLIRAPEPVVPVRTAPVPNVIRRVPAAAPPRPAPARRPRPTAPCLICLDIPDEFPQHRPTTRCTHSITICAPCLQQHISHAVLSQGSTTLNCPDPSCRQAMEYADVIRATKGAKACQERYESLLLRRTLEAEPNFVWCKNARCNWGQVHESGANAPIVICQVCRARSCFTHNVPWHTGQTCTQYDAQHVNRERENRASEAYISQHAKQCPNPRCGRRIEKSEGCDHMTCRLPAGCGHEFCWVCLADYRTILREGNHRHNSTCRYYAAIQRAPAFDGYLQQQRWGAPLNPPPRPQPPRVPVWNEPVIPPRPVQPPVRPVQQNRTQEAPSTGSSILGLAVVAFVGWMFGR